MDSKKKCVEPNVLMARSHSWKHFLGRLPEKSHWRPRVLRNRFPKICGYGWQNHLMPISSRIFRHCWKGEKWVEIFHFRPSSGWYFNKPGHCLPCFAFNPLAHWLVWHTSVAHQCGTPVWLECCRAKERMYLHRILKDRVLVRLSRPSASFQLTPDSWPSAGG